MPKYSYLNFLELEAPPGEELADDDQGACPIESVFADGTMLVSLTLSSRN